MSQQTGPPLYGGWRRVRKLGVGPLDGRQTLMLGACVLVPLLTGLIIGLSPALALLPPALVGAVASVWTRRGVWVVDLALAWIRFTRARARGQTHYRSQAWAPHPRRRDLPGVLAPTRLVEVNEPGRGQAGLVWNQRTGLMTATLMLSPTGALLADQGTVTHQVGAWGNELAALADTPAIDHAAVTVQMVPASGVDLAEHVAQRTDQGAPELARQVMDQVVDSAPTSTTRIDARMSLSVDLKKTPAREVGAMVTETLRILGGLSLHPSGVDVLRRASATDLVRTVRGAFDPPSMSITDEAQWSQVQWSDTGPVAAQEEWGYYAHDGAYSATWCLVAAPRQHISHDVLLPLLVPGPYTQRLTLMYRTLSREEAGLLLKREQDAAAARRHYEHRTGKDPSARNADDEARAHQAAAEEAQGAGICEFSLFITATCADLEELEQARRHVEQAAAQARLLVRPCWGGQAAAFAVGLGVAGLYPPDL